MRPIPSVIDCTHSLTLKRSKALVFCIICSWCVASHPSVSRRLPLSLSPCRSLPSSLSSLWPQCILLFSDLPRVSPVLTRPVALCLSHKDVFRKSGFRTLVRIRLHNCIKGFCCFFVLLNMDFTLYVLVNITYSVTVKSVFS